MFVTTPRGSSTRRPLLVALALVPLFVRGSLQSNDACIGARVPAFVGGAGVVVVRVLCALRQLDLPAISPARVPGDLRADGGGGRDPLRDVAATGSSARRGRHRRGCVTLTVQFARNQEVFRWRDHEQRYVRAAGRAAELTPAGAVLFSSQHSGSLRYYADRMTLRYDLLAEGHLDSAIRELKGLGRPSFLVIDEWERADFRRRFAGRNRAGGLEWGPLARVPGRPDVLVYNLRDRAE